jgi:serine/threonine protein kinase
MSKRGSLDHFELKDKLGSGSFGTVYLVKCIFCLYKNKIFYRKIDDDKIYCMKIIQLANLEPLDFENAKKEANLLSKISSPFVIKYIDCFFDQVFFICFNFNLKFLRIIFILLWNMQMEKH